MCIRDRSSSFVAALLYADEKSSYNMPVGATEVSSSIFDLHMLIFWICVVIGVIVFSIMFWSLWKYRKSKGAVAADFDDNFWLEVGWTVAATLVLVWMAVPSTQVMVEAYDDAEGEINIMVTGHQWKCCLLYTSPSPRDATLSRMPSSA